MGLRHPVSYIYTYNIICALHTCNKNISRARDAGHIYIHIDVTYILYIYMLRIYIYVLHILYTHYLHMAKTGQEQGTQDIFAFALLHLHLHYEATPYAMLSAS